MYIYIYIYIYIFLVNALNSVVLCTFKLKNKLSSFHDIVQLLFCFIE